MMKWALVVLVAFNATWHASAECCHGVMDMTPDHRSVRNEGELLHEQG